MDVMDHTLLLLRSQFSDTRTSRVNNEHQRPPLSPTLSQLNRAHVLTIPSIATKLHMLRCILNEVFRRVLKNLHKHVHHVIQSICSSYCSMSVKDKREKKIISFITL